MKAKEVKAALADEDVQTAVSKQIGAAVKAEQKRILAIVKGAELPEDKVAKKAVVKILAEITTQVKLAA